MWREEKEDNGRQRIKKITKETKKREKGKKILKKKTIKNRERIKTMQIPNQ